MIILRKAIQECRKSGEVITDYGTQFFSNVKNVDPNEPNELQNFISDQRIRHIFSKVKHSETNGKLARVNGILKNLRRYSITWEEVCIITAMRGGTCHSVIRRDYLLPSAMAYCERENNGKEEAV